MKYKINNSSTNFPVGVTIYKPETRVFETINFYNYSTGAITFPENGFYEIGVNVLMDGGATGWGGLFLSPDNNTNINELIDEAFAATPSNQGTNQPHPFITGTIKIFRLAGDVNYIKFKNSYQTMMTAYWRSNAVNWDSMVIFKL